MATNHQNGVTVISPVTSPDTDRFSEFFYLQSCSEIATRLHQGFQRISRRSCHHWRRVMATGPDPTRHICDPTPTRGVREIVDPTCIHDVLIAELCSCCNTPICLKPNTYFTAHNTVLLQNNELLTAHG